MINKYIMYLSLIVPILFIGCAGAGSGVVTSKVSKFDNSKEVVMQTAWVAPAEGGMAEISLGLTFRSSQPEGIILKANLTNMSGVTDIQNIAISIDGKIITAKPVDNIASKKDTLTVIHDTCTYTYGFRTCTKGIAMKSLNKIYIIPSNMPASIIKAKNAFIRIEADGRYIEGDLKANSFGNNTFKDNLPKFVANIK